MEAIIVGVGRAGVGRIGAGKAGLGRIGMEAQGTEERVGADDYHVQGKSYGGYS